MKPVMLTPNESAVLLLAHGTPDTLSQMAAYLANVTGGRPMPQHVVEELQHRYAAIGLRDEPLPEHRQVEERPPLTRWTLVQGRLLGDALGRKVYVGMRNWSPYIADAVAAMKADGVTHAQVLCLAPQNSRTSTGLYRRALEKEVDGAFAYEFIAGWSDEPLLARAFAETLKPAIDAARANDSGAMVLFTAHSVPCRTIRATSTEQAAEGSAPVPGAPVPAEGLQNYGTAEVGDPYPVECKDTARAVARQLGLKDTEWVFSFQSQGIAGAPWIGPTVEDTLTALAQQGVKSVVMQPIGFLCDHVEILYDIDVAFREFAQPLGITLSRAASLNDSPTLIAAIVKVLDGSRG
jgi:ferrochelatase